ncbi:NAD(P)-dependent oxidoreductase [Bordetella petrii]|uniref:NAD(P)-dependent oxidoreductase n=1 Tax=Bordetella petrii TaxID=94624 RepID=UPI001E5DB033|nr:NAD(P)-dependent oxidoreductase [Bordetella petrii]MCD0502703.1 NAD(P)-dependent oxidoreductase [Bordetella petrii]
MTDPAIPTLGFIGLGNIGAPMCWNIATKHPAGVIVHDLNPAAYAALEGTAARRAGSLADLAQAADIVFLSLPGSAQVEAVCLGPDGLAAGPRPPALIIDLSTTTVATARNVEARLREKGIAFVDAPVARTAEAARRGELSIMVGAAPDLFERVEPYLRYIGSDVTRCGGAGCGQVVKLINNALVFEHTAALAEMMVLGQRAGVDPALLLDALSKGSGDSFVLRNHGMKAMLPRQFPAGGFPPEYALKDISYVLDLAQDTRSSTAFVELAHRYYDAAARKGFGRRYFPTIIEMLDQSIGPVLDAQAPGGPAGAPARPAPGNPGHV